MKNNEILTKTVIDLFKYAVENKVEVRVTDLTGVIDTYDDASGQRRAYLSYWGPSSEGVNTTEPGKFCIDADCFYVRRKLSFVNKGDEGKEDAILFSIYGKNIAKAKEISINGEVIIIDNIKLHLYKPC